MIVAAVALRVVKAAVPPTVPVKVVVPVPPVSVKVCAPLRVLLKEMLALLDKMVLGPVKLTGLGNVKGLAPVMVMLFPI